MNFEAKVVVSLKQSVNDPQGNAVTRALHALGFESVKEARIGRFVSLSFEASTEQDALAMVERMCDQLLANPVIEGYTGELDLKNNDV